MNQMIIKVKSINGKFDPNQTEYLTEAMINNLEDFFGVSNLELEITYTES